MSRFRPKAILLGTLAMLLVGLFATASAEAQGPYWYHRPARQEIKGIKITGQALEEVRGTGGEQRLETEIARTPIVIVSPQVQLKGAIYNNNFQAQAKLTIVLESPQLSGIPNCRVLIGSQNTFNVTGHQIWKWNGEQSQRTEQPIVQQKPYWLFMSSGVEITQGATEITKALIVGVTLSGGGCGVLAGTYGIKGSVAASITPMNLGEFFITQRDASLPSGIKQHFWNGVTQVGDETKLEFTGTSTASANLSGQFELKVLPNPQTGIQQEVALFEG